MIEWSHKKTTMVDGSRMHFACSNFDNQLVHKLFISKMYRNMLKQKLFRLKTVTNILCISRNMLASTYFTVYQP